jgi:4-carboxymuconolactone decarboxylase
MTRLSPVDPARLSPEQKELYESIVSGPRAAKRPALTDEKGSLTGPFNAFLHVPALGKHWSAIGERLRFQSSIDRRLFELSILVIATHWTCGHEWAAHAALAEAAGVKPGIIATIRRGERPAFQERDEEIVYDFVHELVTQHRAGDAAYRGAHALLGETQLVELANAVGYYVALAVMLNAFDVHPPKGFDDPWPS